MTTLTPQPGTQSLVAPYPNVPAVNRLGLDGRPVPILRGRLHEVVALPFALAGLMVALRVDGVQQVAVAIFTVSVVAMLAASAAYHCHTRSLESKLQARRLDHAMIFVAIGGCQTAFWLLVAPAGIAIAAITAVWVIAAAGIHHKLNKLTLTETTGSWLYIALGWTGVLMLPYLVGAGDMIALAGVIIGGLVYFAGGAVLARRLVDPWPKVFGYHEVWHLMVVVGIATHFVGVVRLTETLG